MKQPIDPDLLEPDEPLTHMVDQAQSLAEPQRSLSKLVFWMLEIQDQIEHACRKRSVQAAGIGIMVTLGAIVSLRLEQTCLLRYSFHIAALAAAAGGVAALWKLHHLAPDIRWQQLSGRFAVFAGIVAVGYLAKFFAPAPVEFAAGAFRLESPVLIASIWLGAAWAVLSPPPGMTAPGGHSRR